MSQLRKINLKFNTDVSRRVANEMNAEVRENDFIYSYSTRNIKADIVIRKNGMEFGIKNEELIYDDMCQELVNTFVGNYVETLLKDRGYSYTRTDTRDKILIQVGVA